MSAEDIYLWYTNWIFINDSRWNWRWIDDDSKVNMWWWGIDDNDFNLDDGSRKIENMWDRQWPCPDWFHVPSYSEWAKLQEIINDLDFDTIRNYLKIPIAWFRHADIASVGYLWQYGNLWTSSPSTLDSPMSRAFWVNRDRQHFVYSLNRWFGVSMRCFYNYYQRLFYSFDFFNCIVDLVFGF